MVIRHIKSPPFVSCVNGIVSKKPLPRPDPFERMDRRLYDHRRQAQRLSFLLFRLGRLPQRFPDLILGTLRH